MAGNEPDIKIADPICALMLGQSMSYTSDIEAQCVSYKNLNLDMNAIVSKENIEEIDIYAWIHALKQLFSSSDFSTPPKIFEEQINLIKKTNHELSSFGYKLNHLVKIAYLGSKFITEANLNPEKSQVMDVFMQLEREVLADRKVDMLEEAVLVLISAPYCGTGNSSLSFSELEPEGFPIVNAIWGLMLYLSKGLTLPDLNQQKHSFVRVDYYQRVNKGYPSVMYLNMGMPDICDSESNHTVVQNNDREVKKRDRSEACYRFALSGSSYWQKDSANIERCTNTKEKTRYECYFTIIEKKYRPIDLAKEKARPGDIVTYYSYRNTIEHMAVITKVDRNGIPKQAISYNSTISLNDEDIIEHPIEQMTRQYGCFFSIMRHR